MEQLPLIICCAVGAALLYFLNRYRKECSLKDWYARVIADAGRAQTDVGFRNEQIADAEAELANHPKPNPIIPLRGNQEFFIQFLPSVTMAFAGVGCLMIGIGLSRDKSEIVTSYNWTLYMGMAFILLCGFYIYLTERAKKTLARIRQLNRLNLLYKASQNKAGVESTLRELIQYYPAMTALRLELANQIALEGNVDEAVDMLKNATASMKDDIDKAMVDLSFYLSWKATDAAQEVVDRLPELSNLHEDARPDLYAAALEMVRGDREKAKEYTRKAVALDSSYVDYLVNRDKSLQGMSELVEEVYEELKKSGPAKIADEDDDEDEDDDDYDDEDSEELEYGPQPPENKDEDED